MAIFLLIKTLSKSILIKLDRKNAFNAVRRDHLEVCHHRAPSVYNLARLAYQQQSELFCKDQIISSASGVQQGDRIGPLLFALAVDGIARSVSAPLNIWYLDDATLGGPVDKIIHDLGAIILALSMIGLEINAVNFQKALEKIQSILKEVQITALEKLVMLGAPIFSSAVKDSFSAKHSQLLKLIDRLSYLSAHQAFFFFKNCLVIPKLFFILYKYCNIFNKLFIFFRNILSIFCLILFSFILQKEFIK